MVFRVRNIREAYEKFKRGIVGHAINRRKEKRGRREKFGGKRKEEGGREKQ
jgi:hypothetical protein